MPATIAGVHLGLDTHANRPAANAAGQPFGALYSCSTHNLIYKTDGSTWATWGTLSGGSGSVATDTIWDAAGDLVQGTGADAAAKLSAGTAGMFLKSAGAAAANLWAFPPGYEIDYVQKTSSTSITATTEATANTVVTATATAFDGSTVVFIEFYSDAVNPSAGASNDITIYLYDGSSSIGVLSYILCPAAAGIYMPVYLSRRLTPSNATHTYSIRASVSTGTGGVAGGAGGAAANMPCFIRITRV